MSKESFLIFKSFYEPIKGLSIEHKGLLLDALFQYQIDSVEPKNNSPIYMPFLFFKNQFRLDNAKYDAVCEKNKVNGIKGGRPKELIETTQNNPSVISKPKKAYNDNGNDNGNVKEKEKKEVNKAKIPFGDFWVLFDSQSNPKVVEGKWNNLSLEDQQKILIFIPKYHINKPDKQYRKSPANFFKEETWKYPLINSSTTISQFLKPTTGPQSKL